jgi:predicted CopG family antitoxin
MGETITISKDAFDELIRKKEEFDAIVESIELMNDPEVQKSIKDSKADIKAGRVHNIRDVLQK